VPQRLLVVLYPGVADWEVSFPLFCLRPGIADTLGWFEGAARVDEAVCADGKILTASVAATLPFTIQLARLLGNEKTADEIDAFFVR